MAIETFVPGMEESTPNRNNLYTRSASNPINNLGGTYVPGMQQNAPGVEQEAQQPQQILAGKREEPVVGFLYSISRKGIGEYWPLHLGANTIGRSAECSIQLKELSVSEKHAVLNVRKMKSTSEVIASVRDVGSKNGMYLNNEELDFENHSCKNGDVLTVGTCYQLLVILINTQQFGLKVAQDFQAAPVPVADSMLDSDPFASSEKDGLYGRHKQVDDGTVDLGGASPFLSGDTSVL